MQPKIVDDRAPIGYANERTPESYERNKKRQSKDSTDINIRGGNLPYRFATRPSNIIQGAGGHGYKNFVTNETVIETYLKENPSWLRNIGDKGNPLSQSPSVKVNTMTPKQQSGLY